MLGWALTFLVVALIAGVLGFTTIAGAAIGIAKIAFYVFLVLFVVSLIMNFVPRPRDDALAGYVLSRSDGPGTRCDRARSASPSTPGRRCGSPPLLFPPH